MGQIFVVATDEHHPILRLITATVKHLEKSQNSSKELSLLSSLCLDYIHQALQQTNVVVPVGSLSRPQKSVQVEHSSSELQEGRSNYTIAQNRLLSGTVAREGEI